MSFLNLNWIKENFTNDKFVFFEIGCAHLDTSCKLRELMPAAEIYAFEPAVHWHEINEQLAKKFNINYFKYALSDVDGLLSFNPSDTEFDNPHPWSSSLFQLEDMPYESHGKKYGEPYKVYSCKLENFCYQFNLTPDVLHIDAEGAEFKIVNNMGKFRPKCIWAEIAGFGHYKNGVTKQQFDEALKELGYTKIYTDANQCDALYCLDGIEFSEYRGEIL